MPYRRAAAAAAVLLAAIYGKLLVPAFQEELLPAVYHLLETEQVRFVLPESVAAWLIMH